MGTFQDLREVVRRLKHRSGTRKYCPVCGSPQLKLAGGADFWLMPGKFVCQDCGYKGFIVMEKDEDDYTKEGAEKRDAAKKEASSDSGKENFLRKPRESSLNQIRKRVWMKEKSMIKLLLEMMKNSRRSSRDLAKVLGVSQPTVTRTRQRLEK